MFSYHAGENDMHKQRGPTVWAYGSYHIGLYLPHDLVTAYQTSGNIVVLYRGSVVEAGDVELVVKQPHHPYTQFLMSSIPLASVERTWTTENGTGTVGLQGGGSAGCKFADRCPRATLPCLQAAPPLFHTERY